MNKHQHQHAIPAAIRPRSPRAATLLGTTALLASAAPLAAAIVALTPAPLTSEVPVASSSRALQAGASLNAEVQSHTAVSFSFGAIKYPLEAGD